MPPRGVFGIAADVLFGAIALIAAQIVVAQPTEAPAAENYFDIHEFRVLGNTVLSNLEVERAVYPFLGDHKRLADVESARTALESAYHDKGFATVFVDIPEQEINEAIVRLRATEGRINSTRVGGARYFSERRILAALPGAAAGGVPQLKDLQAQLAVVNEQSADRSVVPILKAGPTPGTVDIAFKVDDHLPLHGSVEINNQNSLNTESLRALYALSYSNLFGEFDNVAVQYQMTPQQPGQVSVVAANYTTRPLGGGLRYAFTFIDSTSDVLAISTLGVFGKGQIYGGRVLFPAIEAAAGSQQFTLGLDYKHFDQSIVLAADQSLATPISYLNLSLAYAGDWRTDMQHLTVNASANFGLRGTLDNETEFANKHFRGQANYFYIRDDNAFVLKLPWGFAFTTRLAGQYAAEPLINNEDYSIAGVSGVRGYLEAEALSDIAVTGTLQLTTAPLRRRSSSLFDGFVFFDAGQASYLDTLPAQPTHQTLRSYGAGFDLFPGFAYATGGITWAHVLDAATYTRRGESRILFFLRGSF